MNEEQSTHPVMAFPGSEEYERRMAFAKAQIRASIRQVYLDRRDLQARVLPSSCNTVGAFEAAIQHARIEHPFITEEFFHNSLKDLLP